jgi:hypothetical protein
MSPLRLPAAVTTLESTKKAERRPLRVANCSGFYGDRLSAAREMVDGGPIDVLTGDWLAELTMLVLAKTQRRDRSGGFARTFVTQMEDVMGDCLDRGIRVVTNAGGLAPAACAEAVANVADRLGLAPSIAYVEGDDLLSRIHELQAAGHPFVNADTQEPLGTRHVLTANAYIGGWGIAEALRMDADIVITGRTTDAALALGPAAWYHGWSRDSWDALAGAVVAGHIIECGPQATGGNYSFFQEISDLENPGFPIAEIAADGSSVITKHPRQGGRVTRGTVTAQLLYEIAGPEYLNPDVTARFDTINLTDDGHDRVRVAGVRGEPPPASLKVCVNCAGGYRTTTSVQLTGLEIDAKADLFQRGLWAKFATGQAAFESVHTELIRAARDEPATNEEALAQLRIVVMDSDEQKVSQSFPAAVTELLLSSFPGLFIGPSSTQAYGVLWPTSIDAHLVEQAVVLNDERVVIQPIRVASAKERAAPRARPLPPVPSGPTVPKPLGFVAGARSGDKGGHANLGVWVRTPVAYAWLDDFLTTERFRDLLPEARELVVERHPLSNLLAVNFVIRGLLGRGVAATTRLDAQAKGLAEYLRAKLVDVPVALLPEGS